MAAGSPLQLLVLAAIATGTAALCLGVRGRPGQRTVLLTRTLAVLLIGSEASWWVYAAVHRLPLSIALPLHLCDVAPLVAAVALLTRRPRWAEVAYFWGLGGSGMALLTPAIGDQPWSFLFTQYLAEHGLTVVAALLLPIGLGLGPRAGAVPRVALATAGLAAVAGVADALTGGNYMFLRHPPDAPTVLALFGPWPWYLLGAAVLVLAALLLLELPFRLLRRGVDLSTAGSS